MRAPGNPDARWNSSKATRRAVRRAAALAAELSTHSFRLHNDGSVTWNLGHPTPEKQPKQTSEGAARSVSSEPKKRQLRSRALQERDEVEMTPRPRPGRRSALPRIDHVRGGSH